MFRIAIFAAIAAAAAFAQDAPKAEPKPPADVDQALRARIKEFYQYHVTEEYRKAEKLVAEDSQDIYYVAAKPRYLNFEIQSVKYSDDFTKAKVSVLCEQFVNSPMFAGKPMKLPSTSTWKVVDGKWMWYVDKEELAKGPFGKMANAGSKATPGTVAPDSIPTSPDYVLGKVKLEQESLVVKPNSTAQVTIANSAPIEVSLVTQQVLPGYKVAFDKARLKPGEKAVVTLTMNENPHAGELQFLVQPTNEILVLTMKRP